MKTEIAKEIERIVNDLDIHKIRMVMEYLDWEWMSCGGIPTQADIYEMAFQLLQSAYEEYNHTPYPHEISTGGLKATCNLIEGKYCFTIGFEIAEADNYDTSDVDPLH